MSEKINFHIKELENMKSYPDELFYIGNTALLNKRKVSIVGTRKPNSYTRDITYKLASGLSKRGVAVVSGCAIGVDAVAHNGAGSTNTIGVVANGLNIRYPRINAKLIQSIEANGLMLSTYKDDEKARAYTFVQRNEIVVSLGEFLIVTQADEKSGTLSSINYALQMGKKVYTIPHRLEESKGTQRLLHEGLIETIYDIDAFLNSFGEIKKEDDDEFSIYLNSNPTYDEALNIYGNKIFELELEGKILVNNGRIKVI